MSDDPKSKEESTKAATHFHTPPNIDDLREFHDFLPSIFKESDRGAVLISSGFLENTLKEILISYLIDDIDPKVIFDGNGPLSSFSSRIKFCYCLALISKEEMQDLEIIRGIRNDFAHKYKVSFEDQSIKDRCANFKSKASLNGVDAKDPKSMFVSGALGMMLRLAARSREVAVGKTNNSPWTIYKTK